MEALNLSNYGEYTELAKNNYQKVDTSLITKENVDQHFNSVLNIIKDALEQDTFKKSRVHVKFVDNIECNLTIPDYLYNLMMWTLPLCLDKKVSSYYLFYDENITKQSIKKYIDDKFILENRDKYKNIILNNIIDKCLSKFKVIDDFSMYLANTVNLEDTLDLMNSNPEVNDIIHLDVSQVPLDQVMQIGNDKVNRFKNIIMNSNHCLKDFFRSGEGVNIKQFKEFSINGGTKPDGRKGVFPAVINNNLLTGGSNDPLSFFIEESTGRISQLIIKHNVGKSGSFARLLGLNNVDTFLHPDPNYDCGTHNFEEIVIEDFNMLSRYQTGRYFRFKPNGVEYKITPKGYVSTNTNHPEFYQLKDIIGKKIYLRSPMTCASHARGEGICYKCYGDLAHTNEDINIGKIAAEELSSKLTQMMLSVKHLLQSAIRKIKWVKEFKEYFGMKDNIIFLSDEMVEKGLEGYKLIIDKNNIIPEDDFDSEYANASEYNEYIIDFEIETPTGEIIKMYNDDSKEMYLTTDLNEVIRSSAKPLDDSRFYVNLKDLEEIPIFIVEISNSDLSDTLNKIKNIINNGGFIKEKHYDKNTWLEDLIRVMIKGKLNVSSVHAEVILSNQLKNPNYIFEKPQWEYPNEEYTIQTLNAALKDNPRISVSLSYQSIGRLLYNPLTFSPGKNKPSFMDLFFMKKPQEFINKNKIEIEDEPLVNPNEAKPLFIHHNKDKEKD